MMWLLLLIIILLCSCFGVLGFCLGARWVFRMTQRLLNEIGEESLKSLKLMDDKDLRKEIRAVFRYCKNFDLNSTTKYKNKEVKQNDNVKGRSKGI